MSDSNINYSTDQLKVPPDYGEARCLCGQKLNWRWQCAECHVQLGADEAIFWSQLREGLTEVTLT